MLLSLEAERIISGFSELVANAVTQSLWPVLSNLQQGDIHLEEFLLERENLPCCECKTQSNDEMKEKLRFVMFLSLIEEKHEGAVTHTLWSNSESEFIQSILQRGVQFSR